MKILLLHVISLYSKTNIQLQKNKNTKTKKKTHWKSLRIIHQNMKNESINPKYESKFKHTN